MPALSNKEASIAAPDDEHVMTNCVLVDIVASVESAEKLKCADIVPNLDKIRRESNPCLLGALFYKRSEHSRYESNIEVYNYVSCAIEM